MIRFLSILTIVLWLALAASNVAAQDCPSGYQCVPQATFNQMVDKLNELVEARTLIAANAKERAVSDATLATALKTIEGYKEYTAVKDMIIVKQTEMMALYEKTLKLYVDLVEKLQAQINKPRSAWSKFLSALKTVITLAAGVSLGRGL